MLLRFWKNHTIPVILVTLFTVPSLLALFQPGTISGFDLHYHVVKLGQFHECLKDGQLLARWCPDMGGGYGYPVFLYYPPLVYWVAVVFVWMGMSYAAAVEATVGLSLIVSAITMYALMSKRFEPRAGILGAVVFVYAPYHLVTAYVKGAIAELFSFVWIPLIFLALYNLKDKTTAPRIFALSFLYAALILTNNSSALLFTLTFIAFIVFIGLRDGDYRYMRVAVIGFTGGALLSAFFWVPALIEKDFVQITKMTSGYFDFNNHFVPFRSLLFSEWLYGPSGYPDQFSRMIGVLHWGFLFAGVVFLRKRIRGDCLFYIAIFVLSVFMTLKSSALIWAAAPLLPFLQFPWKFLAVIMFAGSFLSGYLMVMLRSERERWVVLLVLLAVQVLISFPQAKPARSILYPMDYGNSQSVSLTSLRGMQQETVTHYFSSYLPTQVNVPPVGLANSEIVPNNDVTLIEKDIRSDHYRFKLEIERPTSLVVNTFWFPGWQAFVNSEPVVIEALDVEGKIVVPLLQGEHELVLSFDDTPIRFWSSFVSICTFVVTVAVFILFSLRRQTD